MAHRIVLRGEVVGGHEIEDLGVTVPYRETVSVDRVSADRSRDLTDALRLGQVRHVRTVGVMHSSPQPRQQPRPSARVANKPTRQRPPTRRAPAPATGVASPPSEEVAELRAQNAQLAAHVERLVQVQEQVAQRQAELVTQLERALAGGRVPPAIGQGPPRADEAGTEVGRPDLGAYEDDEGEDEVLFIPSQIRSGRGKITGGSAIESEAREDADAFDDAAKALAALRKKHRDD